MTAAVRELDCRGMPCPRPVIELAKAFPGVQALDDVHLEVDPALSVAQGHDIAVTARARVMQRHRVLNVMTHVDPQGHPDLDHGRPPAGAGPEPQGSA